MARILAKMIFQGEQHFSELQTAVVRKSSKLLLEGGASVEQRDFARQSALHTCAIARGVSTDIVRLLMDYGAIIDSRDSEGRAPLMLAIESDVL